MTAGSTSHSEPVERHEVDERDVLVQRDEGLVVAAQEVDLLVVEDHRRRDRPEALRGDVVQRVVGVVPVVEGEVAGELDLGLGVQLEDGPGDDAQGALMLHEEVLEAVPGGALADLLGAAAADPDDLAVGEHALHADHRVRDVSVAAADQGPAAAADAPADHGVGVAGEVVREELAERFEHLVQLERVHARADRHARVLLVDLEDLVHALDVDADALAQRHGTVGEAGGAAARSHRDAALIGQLEDADDVLRAPGQHDDVGSLVGPAVQRERRAVGGAHRPLVHLGEHVLLAEQRPELGDHVVGDRSIRGGCDCHGPIDSFLVRRLAGVLWPLWALSKVRVVAPSLGGARKSHGRRRAADRTLSGRDLCPAECFESSNARRHRKRVL